MGKRLLFALILVLGSAILLFSFRTAPPTHALVIGGDIYVMNADGSGQTNLTNNPAEEWWPAWSPDGTRIAFTSNRDGNFDIYVMNADGSGQTNLTNNPAASDTHPTWSPDGTRIAFASEPIAGEHSSEIAIMNADGSGVTRLTSAEPDTPGLVSGSPDWSPDGTRIVFTRAGPIDSSLLIINSDGTGLQVLDEPFYTGVPAWSPDSSRIAFYSNDQVFVMHADGSNPINLTAAEGHNTYPDWSPDGTRIVFAAERGTDNQPIGAGNHAIYVMNADGSGQTRLTNNPMATEGAPAWSPDGTRIAFQSAPFEPESAPYPSPEPPEPPEPPELPAPTATPMLPAPTAAPMPTVEPCHDVFCKP
jgi:TolB protein